MPYYQRIGLHYDDILSVIALSHNRSSTSSGPAEINPTPRFISGHRTNKMGQTIRQRG